MTHTYFCGTCGSRVWGEQGPSCQREPSSTSPCPYCGSTMFRQVGTDPAAAATERSMPVVLARLAGVLERLDARNNGATMHMEELARQIKSATASLAALRGERR